MTPLQKVDLLRAACCVAGCDSETTTAERQLIDRLAKAVGVGTASVNAMIARAQSDPEFHRLQFQVMKSDSSQTMAILLEVALADGKLSAAEINVLRGLSENLGVSPAVFDELLSKISAMLPPNAPQ